MYLERCPCCGSYKEPICPKCDTEMKVDDFSNAICGSCNHSEKVTWISD